MSKGQSTNAYFMVLLNPKSGLADLGLWVGVNLRFCRG